MSEATYQKCPICNSPAEIADIFNIASNIINCYRCGKYKLTSEAFEDCGELNQIQIANFSGWIRENQRALITTEKYESLKDLNTPEVGEKATKLLKYIATELPIPGQKIQIDFQFLMSIQGRPIPDLNLELRNLKKYLPFLSITWSNDGSELKYIIKEFLIEEKKYLLGDSRCIISPKGWAYLDSLKYKIVDSQIAFVAMNFDKKMDYLYEHLESAIIKAGYQPKRVDKHEHVNKVDDEIIALIRQSKFIVADFTGQRGGVYFESGFAHGLNIPVIWLCNNKEKKKLHFDTNHFNYIFWDKENLDVLQTNLTKRIIHILGKGTYNLD